ncbi:MAG: hypothetical protein GVY13_11075 [Alphaproteobacteria bacterium]|jgi:hypothetical protein|nr:hypothetical protein [Alphaproteobacteria bacterium]
MFGSLALEIAIGLFLFFLLFSLICTALQEMVTSLFSLRFRNLQQGLYALLNDPQLVDEVLASPAIERLMHPRLREKYRAQRQGSAAPATSARAAETPAQSSPGSVRFLRTRGPSYVPPDVFVAALLEALHRRQLSNPAGDEKRGASPDPDTASDSALPGYALFQDAKALIETIPDTNPLKESLLLALTRTGQGVEGVEEELKTWFNQTMERVSGWYRRQIKVITFGIAAVLAIGLNANAIQIGIALAENQDLRSSVLGTAQAVVDVTERDGTAQAADGSGPETLTITLPAILDPSSQAGADVIASGIAQFPIGWGDACAFAMVGAADPADNCGPWWVNLIEALGGWLTTIAAASLGAPFWFNLLDKLVKIRGSGNPVPTSQQS